MDKVYSKIRHYILNQLIKVILSIILFGNQLKFKILMPGEHIFLLIFCNNQIFFFVMFSLAKETWDIIFTNPSTQAGYDTRSIFKRSLTGLNSEFSFS